MAEEIETILDHMTIEDVSTRGARTFYTGSIECVPCVVVLSGIGKVASAVTAAILIEVFQITELIVTGVAGGVHDTVHIGDVVIATGAIQHDMDCSPLFPQYEIPLVHTTTFTTDKVRTDLVAEVVKTFITEHWKEVIDTNAAAALGIIRPTVHKGLLLSGDQFIGSPEQLAALQKAFPEALMVEMEGAAVAQVCLPYQLPLYMFRSISDKANAQAHVDFTAYIETISRPYTWYLIQHILQAISKV
jgi:adenosylhomocysteine nucleosidase